MPFLKIVLDFYMWQPYCLFQMNVWLGFIEKCSLYHLLIEALQSVQKMSHVTSIDPFLLKGFPF